MNDTQLQRDFYKRYGISKNRVSFSKTGLLCTLIGNSEIEDYPFISCGLSMCVRAMGRRLNGKLVKLENTHTGNCSIYRFDEISKNTDETSMIIKEFLKHSEFGAEILYDSTIPESFMEDDVLNITLVNSLFKTIQKDYDIYKKASLIKDFRKSLAMLYEKKGYCTLMNGSRHKNLPLPLMGYKILLVRTRLKKSPRKKLFEKSDFDAIKRIYPHILSVNDLTEDMLKNPKTGLNKEKINIFRYLICEREFVNISEIYLKALKIKNFAETINRSEDKFRQLCYADEKAAFAVDVLRDMNECICAKQQHDSVFAFVREDFTDNAVNILTHSFSQSFGYEPSICICNTCTAE